MNDGWQPPAGEVRGHALKLSRADHQFDKLERAIDAWEEATSDSCTEEPDPNVAGEIGFWVNPPPFPDVTLSVLIGECLQGYRSALDHLAFELASAFTTPMTDEIEDTSAFPIYNGINKNGQNVASTQWKAAVAGCIAGIDPAAQTVIETLQPYHRGNQYTDHPLWRLNRLNNIDKHRVLHATAVPVGGIEMLNLARMRNVVEVEIDELEVFSNVSAVRRAQVARFIGEYTPVVPGKKVEMNPAIKVNVVFGSVTPLVGEADVLDVLSDIRSYIATDVIPPLAPFLK